MDALPPGTRLAEFEILALLGVGGFGMVYKAFDHSLHRAVAIKEYMPSALAGRAQGQSLWVRSSSDQMTFNAGLASFVGEARLLAQFDHPSLVKVFRFWEANNTAYMVMPLYSGMTFKQARAQMRTPPPEIWLRKVLWSVLGALRVLHEGNTLHRDISPDNIFLQDVGPPVLLDLGAARHAINDQDRKHTAVLKVNYAPIEQYSDGDQDLRQGPWSDLYSLAAVVHGCLCNDTPLPSTLRSIRDRMVSFSRVARTVKRQFGVEYSEPFVAAIAQSLALKPEDRPQSIDAFLQTMGMTTAPEGIEFFDFRNELGDIWVEPADQPGPGLLTPTVDITSAPRHVAEMEAQAPAAMTKVAHREEEGDKFGADRETEGRDAGGDTVMLAGPDTIAAEGGDTVFIDAGDTVVAEDSRYDDVEGSPRLGPGTRREGEPRHRHATRKSGKSGRAAKARRGIPVLVWFGVAALAVVASAAGLRWVQNSTAPEDTIITEMAEPASVTPPVALAVADTAEVAGAQASAAEIVASEGEASAAVAAASALVVASPPRAAPRANRRAVPEPPPTPIVVREEPPPPPPPPVVAEPKPRPAPPRIPGPQEACADASFLARPLCIHRECQKPALAGHSICVENRRRYEAEEQRNRQSPN